MKTTLERIIDLRYTEPTVRIRLLSTLSEKVRSDSNPNELSRILGVGTSQSAVLIAAFAVWLDEISYVWDKDSRSRQIEDLKDAAAQLSVDYRAIYSSHMHSEKIKEWMENNLKPL